MKDLWKNISFATDIIKARLAKEYRPFQVQFSITDHCNLRCSYCYANYPDRKHKDLTTEEVFRIIDELAELRTRRVNLVGGEPLMRKDIGVIIDRIKARGIECAMTSNGYFMARKIEDVKKLNLLCISLDGDKKAHDANRGKGSYEKAMEAVKLARENNIPIQVAAVLTKNSLNSVEYLLKKGKELGIFVGFSTLINQSVDGKKNSAPNIPTDQEYKEVLKKIIKLKDHGYPVLFSKKTLDYALNWKYGYDEDKIMGKDPDFKYIKCLAGRLFAIIDVNGDVYPCPALVDVIKPMNCLEVGVKKAFDHLNNHQCMTCHIPCQNEFNLMYSLDPAVIWNIISSYKGN